MYIYNFIKLIKLIKFYKTNLHHNYKVSQKYHIFACGTLFDKYAKIHNFMIKTIKITNSLRNLRKFELVT